MTEPAKAVHRMIAGSHERPTGPECACGSQWSRTDGVCAASAPSSPTPTPVQVDQFFSLIMCEHYNADGVLMLATSNAADIVLESGDFLVRRWWTTDVVPYLYERPNRPGVEGEHG